MTAINMSFLKNFKKEVGKIEGITTDASPPKYWFSLGNYVLNKIISSSYHKGVPQGRITCVAGPSGAGKSFVLGNIIKQAQKEGAYILVIDSENALDDDFMTAIGVNVNENYSYVGVTTIPQVINVISKFIKGYREEYGNDPNAPKIVIGIDSLDMLMTESELDKYEKGDSAADQGQHPKQLKQMLRTLTNDIKSLNISAVVTKQVYGASQQQIMKGEGVWVINDAIRYACSQIILVSRLKLKDGEKAVTGIRMKCEGFKTRFTLPFQTVTIEVPYSTGMDEYSGLIDVAVAVGALKVPSKGWYSLPGSDKKLRAADVVPFYDQIIESMEAMDKNTYLTADIAEGEEVKPEGPSLQARKYEKLLAGDSVAETEEA